MYKISYDGDGETTEFLFAFPFFQDADIRVAVDNVVLESTQYGVVANDEFDGGRVVLAAAPAVGAQIDIFRQIALARVIDYQPTAKIDPEHLNADFNFLLEAFRDLRNVDIDLSQWNNTFDNVMEFLNYTMDTIKDKLAGGGVLGSGAIFGHSFGISDYTPLIFVLAPGAFLVLGYLMVLFNKLAKK